MYFNLCLLFSTCYHNLFSCFVLSVCILYTTLRNINIVRIHTYHTTDHPLFFFLADSLRHYVPYECQLSRGGVSRMVASILFWSIYIYSYMYSRVIHILIYILAALRRHAEQDVQRSVRHVLRVADPYDARFVHLVTAVTWVHVDRWISMATSRSALSQPDQVSLYDAMCSDID